MPYQLDTSSNSDTLALTGRNPEQQARWMTGKFDRYNAHHALLDAQQSGDPAAIAQAQARYAEANGRMDAVSREVAQSGWTDPNAGTPGSLTSPGIGDPSGRTFTVNGRTFSLPPGQHSITVNGQTYTASADGSQLLDAVGRIVGSTTGGGGSAGGTGGTFTPSGGTAAQQDAYAYLKGVLDQYDLGSLAQWAWGELSNNRAQSQVALDLLDQPAYKQRFGKVIDERRASGLPPVSAGEIVAYENQWSQIARAGGLPTSFQGRDVAQELLANNVSAAEANDRVQQVYVKVAQAPVEVRAAFDSFFGTRSDAAFAALLLDPERALPDLERQVTEAQAGGAAHQHGFTIDEALARRLAQQGVSFDQAQQGFGVLESEKHLFDQTISEASPLSSTTGVEAQFGLTPGAQEQVQRVAERRRADYAAGYGLAETQGGLIGAGQATQT